MCYCAQRIPSEVDKHIQGLIQNYVNQDKDIFYREILSGTCLQRIITEYLIFVSNTIFYFNIFDGLS